MWRRITLYIFLIILPLSGRAQEVSDTLPKVMSILKSANLTAGLDRRFLYLKDTKDLDGLKMPIRLTGARVGWWLSRRHQLGLGYSFVRQPLKHYNLLDEPIAFSAGLRRLSFFTVYYQPFLVRNEHWEISLPVDIGWGRSRYEYISEPVRGMLVKTGNFIPAGAGLSVTAWLPALPKFKPLHWLGLNVYAGYRTTLKKDFHDSKTNYSGFFYSIGPTFYLGRFWNDTQDWRRKHKLTFSGSK